MSYPFADVVNGITSFNETLDNIASECMRVDMRSVYMLTCTRTFDYLFDSAGYNVIGGIFTTWKEPKGCHTVVPYIIVYKAL